MGEHLKLREATEKANMSIEVIKELAPEVKNNTAMLNALTKIVYEVANRLAAVEIVLTRYLDHNSTISFSEHLAMYVVEQQAAQEKANAADESVVDSPEPTETQTTDAQLA